MDNRMIMELAKQLGLPEETAEAKAKEYIGKSDEEILREIKRIKTILKKDKKTDNSSVGRDHERTAESTPGKNNCSAGVLITGCRILLSC